MKLFLLLAVFAVLIIVSRQDNSQLEKDETYDWEKFKVKYNKSYAPGKEAERRAIFERNVKRVQDSYEDYRWHRSPWHLHINKYSDWTDEEYFILTSLPIGPHG